MLLGLLQSLTDALRLDLANSGSDFLTLPNFSYFCLAL